MILARLGVFGVTRRQTQNIAPVAPVLLMRSLPARSHSVSLPTVRTPLAALVPTTLMISRQCDRDECALICAHHGESLSAIVVACAACQ